VVLNELYEPIKHVIHLYRLSQVLCSRTLKLSYNWEYKHLVVINSFNMCRLNVYSAINNTVVKS